MTDIEKWNLMASDYANWLQNHPKGFFFNDALTSAIIKKIPLDNTQSILDLGCGDGFLINLLKNKYANLLGIDGASNMIEIAKKNNSDIENKFWVADITKELPLETASFDIILSNMVLMDLSNIKLLLNEVFRILKPLGLFVFTINHPCFSYISHQESNLAKRYLDCFQYEKKLDKVIAGNCNNYHRPIQYYINELLTSNLQLKSVEEISIDLDEKTRQDSSLEQYYLTANGLLIECYKPA